MRAEDVGLSGQEYDTIISLMEREPNDLELGLYGALWSEHCSYKNSKALLSRLPHGGAHVVQGPGENAGVVRLTDDVEIAFKVESHNHPSYVEPVQGAATGVGGILRDIIAMGARPMALADMLRFGDDAESQSIMRGVVKGVGQYGNAIGIPTVTGDIGFSETYRANPLVNVLALGLRHPQKRIGASTAEPGQFLVLVGQRTGRDGIHGASLLASRDFSHGDDDLRPTVQVGDPFLGKLLMEATLGAVDEGLLGALQDLGAAGLTSAVAELCESSGVGADLWLDRVPLREPGLTAYEIMLSETQERMLLAVSEERLNRVMAICEHYEILGTIIGQVTATRRIRIHHHDELTADVAANWLVGGAPRRLVDEAWWQELDASAGSLPQVAAPAFSAAMLLDVLSAPDVRDRSFVYRQYDSTIQTNTVRGPGHDAAVLRVRGADVGIALAAAGPGRWAFVDPYAGGVGAVLYALAALAALGAEPLGITDGVNAGNPYKDDSYRALAALIRGVADAAFASGVPVTGGNVSLHNETNGESIWPTVMIGAVGRHPRPLQPVGDMLLRAGQLIYLINPSPLDWGGSAAAWQVGGPSAYPRIDLSEGARVLDAVRRFAAEGRAEALRVVGSGGLASVLVRMMAASNPSLGIDIQLAESDPSDKTIRFYNESPLQWVAAVPPETASETEDYWASQQIAWTKLGSSTESGQLRVDGRNQWSRSSLLQAWRKPYEEERA